MVVNSILYITELHTTFAALQNCTRETLNYLNFFDFPTLYTRTVRVIVSVSVNDYTNVRKTLFNAILHPGTELT